MLILLESPNGQLAARKFCCFKVDTFLSLLETKMFMFTKLGKVIKV